MKTAPLPADEAQRLQALRRMDILDTVSEERFDRITRQAQHDFQVPIALICFVDKDRQWFKSSRGIESKETPRDISFCGHAIHEDELFLVEDASLDPRFADNPLVVDDPGIRFYAAAPIRSQNGYRVGTLCIIDKRPRSFSQRDQVALRNLAIKVERELWSSEPKASESILQQPMKLARLFSSKVGAGLIAGLVFCALLAGVFASDGDFSNSVKLEREKAALSELAIVRANIESTLNAKIYLVHGLTGIVQLTDSLDQSRFQQYAQQLGQNIDGLMSLQLAPGGIVKFVWPYETNKIAIGHDLLADDNRRRAAEAAINSRSIWLAGPLNLIQGGQAIIARSPIFVGDVGTEKFWGFATLLLDTEAVLSAAITPTLLERYDVAVRGVDGLGKEGAVFWGSGTLFRKGPITGEISLPAGSWQVALRPKAGWNPAWQMRQGRTALLASGSALVSFLLFLILRIPARLRKSVREATTSLQQSQSQFRDAVEALPDGFVVFNKLGELALANGNFQSFFRSSEEQTVLAGVKFEQMFSEGVHSGYVKTPLQQSAKEFIEEQVEGFWSVSHRTELALEDGRVIDVLYCSMGDGGRVGFFRDITQLKQDQAQLVTEKMRAEQANQAKSEFLATVSHEVRTPLNAVLGMLELLSTDGSLSSDQRSMASTANLSAIHLLAVLNDILDVSKIEAGKLELEEKAFDINALIVNSSDLIRNQAEEKGLAVNVAVDPALTKGQVVGDAARVRQIVLNLLSNAVKFTDVGSIAISASLVADEGENRRFLVRVEDTGVGFPDSDRETIFEAFSQLESASDRRFGGTGLGLAICKKLVDALGGEISVRSEPGVGSIFELSFCFKRALVTAKPDAPTTDSSLGAVTPRQLGIGDKRLLLVEDGVTNQIVVQAMLKDTGYVIELAENGREAVDAVKRADYDVVLMDIFMPEMDGIEATKIIRKLGSGQHVPIIALTANAMAGDRERFEQSGMNDYLAKPVKRDELLAMLGRYVLTDRRDEQPARFAS